MFPVVLEETNFLLIKETNGRLSAPDTHQLMSCTMETTWELEKFKTFELIQFGGVEKGPLRESNPRPPAPEAGIIPLDQVDTVASGD